MARRAASTLTNTPLVLDLHGLPGHAFRQSHGGWMMLGCAADIGMIALAGLAGVKGISLWWAMIVAFVAGSLALSNGPSYDLVIRANEEGRLKVFPSLLAANALPRMMFCGVVYYVSKFLAG